MKLEPGDSGAERKERNKAYLLNSIARVSGGAECLGLSTGKSLAGSLLHVMRGKAGSCLQRFDAEIPGPVRPEDVDVNHR